MPADGPKLTSRTGVELIHTGRWSISSGTWHATPEALAAAVQATKCPAVRPAVLKLGHQDPRFDGEPALGWVQNLRTTNGGKTLVGDFTGMPQALGQIAATAYPDRSVEGSYNVQCAAGHTHQFVLTGVALLGVTAPGIGTLKSFRDVAQRYGLAASAPVTGGTPVVITIRASVPAASSASTGAPSAPLQTGSGTSMSADSALSPSVKAILLQAVSSGQIVESVAVDWAQKIAAKEWSLSLIEGALKLLPPKPVAAKSAPAQPAPAPPAAWDPGREASVSASAGRGAVPAPPAVNPAYRRNPLVDDIRAAAPHTYRHGLGQGQPPTLFAAGDLPVYCASGIDPSLLLKVPWLARHPIAAAGTQAEANDLLEFYSGSDGEDLARAERMDLHFGNRDYQMRVNDWVTHSSQAAAAAAQRTEDAKVAAAAGRVKAAHEMTDDEVYDAVFGHLERQEHRRRLDDENAILEGRAIGHARSLTQVRASQERRVAAASQPAREVWEQYGPTGLPAEG